MLATSEHPTLLNMPVQGYYIDNSNKDDVLSHIGGSRGKFVEALKDVGNPSVIVPSIKSGYHELPINRVAIEPDRGPRALPLIAVLSRLAVPGITRFMGNLIRPLVSSIARRPTKNLAMGNQKDAILAKFLRGSLAGTNLDHSISQKQIDIALAQKRYQVILDTLVERQQALPATAYIPAGFAPNQKNYSQQFKFQHFTKVIDKLLQNRLLSLSKASSSFVSSLIMNERATL